MGMCHKVFCVTMAKMSSRGRFMIKLAIIIRDYKGKVGADLVKIGACYLHQKDFCNGLKKNPS